MEKKVIAKSILVSWLQIAQKQGIDASIMIEHLNIAEDDAFISFEQFALFLEWLIKKTGDNQLGIKLGEQANIAALGVVGQLIQASKTTKEGLENACKYFNLLSTVLKLDYKTSSQQVSLIFETDQTSFSQSPEACWQLLMTSMIFAYKEVYFLSLQQQKPIELHLIYSARDEIELERLFACPIQWNRSQNLLVFDREILDKKIVHADYELLIHLEKLACQRLTQQMEQLEQFSDTVKSLVYALLDPYFPSLETIARQLNLSERSVQRKLKKENTSYSALITDIKKSIAIDCLAKNISIKETSYLLGYSEPSAFVHAFKNWFGKPPLAYKINPVKLSGMKEQV